MNTFTTVYDGSLEFYVGPNDGYVKVGIEDTRLLLRSFAREVSHKLWNIEFYVQSYYKDRLHAAEELYVHTKGQPFFLGSIYRERSTRIRAIRDELSASLARIGVVNEQAPAFKYLLTEINGNRYVGEELRADVDKYMQQKAAHEELKDSGRLPLFVYVSKDTNNYDCMDVMHIDADSASRDTVRTTIAKRLYDWDALFQQLLPKLSVLNVMKEREYVNGAGMKYADNMFLVVLEEGDGVT